MTDKLILHFTENYMEKIFYFCLKKTGNVIEAEDLSQDIALNVIDSLTRGNIPESFSAWVWQIARNRYSVWANNKHIRSASLTGYDISEYEIAEEDDNIIDEMAKGDTISHLRRELAFIKNEFRHIVVAYYIEDRSVREIATSLSLSDEAVRQRLFRARKLLKEGMNMAREFGKRSYKPEEILFVSSGSSPSGLPWSAIQRRIPKNILLQASNNPSTLEELAIELGIALPYMEEEVEILKNATLLAQQGDKYITNFFILDRECQTDCYNAMRAGSKERSAALKNFFEEQLPEIRALGIVSDHIDNNTLKWRLIPAIIDYCVDTTFEKKNKQLRKRANGEEWGIVGYEDCTLPENTFIGQNGCGNERTMFWAYKFPDYGMWNQCGEMSYMAVLLLGECLRSGKKITDLSEGEKELWDSDINGKYAHADDNGSIVLDIPLYMPGIQKKLFSLLRDHPSYGVLIDNCKGTHDKLHKILEGYSRTIPDNDIEYYISAQMYRMRMMAIHDLVDDGTLKLPENPNTSNLGMCLKLK